jgi:DNA modification methylase
MSPYSASSRPRSIIFKPISNTTLQILRTGSTPSGARAWRSASPARLLGDHKLICGDACCAADVARLMAGCRADLAFLDPPRGDVTGYSEVAMVDGEMSSTDSVRFLSSALKAAASVSRAGALHFVCMDWAHIADLMAAVESIYGKAVDVAVWEKPKAGPGSLYRSQIELIGVFSVGKAPRLDIGRGRRSRSNVWHYAEVNVHALHPTAKPVALVADAIKDGTRKGDVVLDIFAGPGTTVMAAQRVGRHARALEVEPRLVDVAIRRWQAHTRRDAVHAESGLSFDATAARSGHAIVPNGDRGERQ